MQKYKSNITSTSGAAIRGVPVLVLTEAGENAAIFLDRAGAVSAPNPLTTGADGTFYFYAVNGRYSLRTTVDGVTITDEDVVLMMDPQEITVAGPIAEAVAAAQAAAVAAEFAVEGSGIPEIVNAAQNAVLDANAATAQAAAAAALAESAKTDATAAKTAAEEAVTSANSAANAAALSATGAENSALAAAQIETTIDPTFLRSRANHTGMQPIGTVTGLQDALSALSTAGGISNTPAGSIAATNVQAAINELDTEKFGRNTILGAVSQSAGVPTGSVIERGSNANGEYVRFADGTQICTWKTPSSALPAVSLLINQVYKSTGIDILWTFPATFYAEPAVSGAVVAGIGNAWIGAPDNGLNSATSCQFRLYAASAQPGGAIVQMIAIGRWY